MFIPEGIYVAMLTPFSEDGSVNEDELRRIIDFLIDSGIHGLFPLSTVGESIHMNLDEKRHIMEVVLDQSRGRVHVTPGVGSTHPREAIALAKTAKELGCSAVVVSPPYFFPLSPEMIEAYFETIADAVDIPIVLYNIPLFTQPLGYDLVERLSRRTNIVGMKDSSGSMVDFLHFMDKSTRAGSNFHMLTGREETLLPCLIMGAKGCVTATSGILPEIMTEIYEAWKEGRNEDARELQFCICPLVRMMFSLPFPLGFKVALEARGFQMGPPRQPLSQGERAGLDATKLRIRESLTALLKYISAKGLSPGSRPEACSDRDAS